MFLLVCFGDIIVWFVFIVFESGIDIVFNWIDLWIVGVCKVGCVVCCGGSRNE